MGATRVQERSFRAVPKHSRPRVGSQIYLSTYLYIYIYICIGPRYIRVYTSIKGATRAREKSFREAPKHSRPRAGSQIYLSFYLYLSISIFACDRCIHVYTRSIKEAMRAREKSFREAPKHSRPRAGIRARPCRVGDKSRRHRWRLAVGCSTGGRAGRKATRAPRERINRGTCTAQNSIN